MSHHPLFTVVVDLRDDGPALTPTLRSILAQSIGVEQIEVLLVGPAGSERMLKMRQRHPETIRLVPLEAADWWRTGLDAARGRCITFVSGEALYGVRTFEAVRHLLERGADEGPAVPATIAVPALARRSPEKLHRGYEQLPPHGGIVDLLDAPDAFPTSLSVLFLDVAMLRARPIAPQGVFDEALVCLELLRSTEFRLGYAAGTDAGVEAAARSDEKLLPESERTRLEQLLTFLESQAGSGALHPALRSAMVLLFRLRLVRVSDRWFTDDADAEAFKRRIRALLDLLPPGALHHSLWLDNLRLIYLLESAVFLDHPWSIDRDGQVACRGARIFAAAELPLEVMRINARPDELEIEAIFHDYFIGGLELELVSSSGETVRAVEAGTGESPKQRVAEQYASLAHYRRFLLPTTAGTEWRFVYTVPQVASRIPVIAVSHHARTAFASDPEQRSIAGSRYRVGFSEAGGYTVRRGRGSALLYRLRRTIAYMRRFRRVPWSLLASSSRKQLILINDRARYGNDNGEALFRHILEHRPELRNRTWFVLDERAPSYPELVRTGRVVQPLTFKHRRIYLNTRLHLSSHASATYNSPWSGAEAATVSDFADPTFVWLRHGVTMNSVDHVYSRFNNNLDGIVASTAYEKDYLLRPDSLFTERSVVTSGLPRFDLLQDRSREQDRRSLLYMPTWRVWLAGAPHPDGYRLPVPGFEQSEYFEQQQRLMSDPEVTEALQSANAHFEFLLHPVMAGYQELYASLASPTVVVRDPSSTSYSDLFARGAGMITDYSSVFVDFSYMGKPVIFDQSDVGRFRDGHYQKGLFDYETQAPGPVVGDYAQLKRATLELIRSDFAMPETYAARLDGFFLHHEGSSSDRALEAGIRIDEQRRGRGFSAAR